ncbi:LPS export ABC transporter periplasmic protein LptC [Acinetobacter nectaris]|uniref:LPS export ABC transporter periplasmic protein LptC n=1 Tax=Acinetobacter nectaris TaxID=1219382 RepID=UPI001F0133AF|nr:LPS export ABC transporter periplasmic protein LptC [Acinetobacter nectaris]MCF9045908.1 LPS export ABC transporter periplasmic protein LptC [Acinetobacter nectaris]
METKNLYVIALVIAAVSGGYYYYSGNSKKLDTNASRNMTYAAQNVQLTQTDEKGDVSIRASVDQIIQNKQDATTQMYNLHATTYSHGQENGTYYAPRGDGYNDNQKLILRDDVVVNRNSPQGMITFKTDELTGYPKEKRIETNRTVNVDSTQSQFVSQGLNADLNSGQYEFFNIRGKYAPKS